MFSKYADVPKTTILLSCGTCMHWNEANVNISGTLNRVTFLKPEKMYPFKKLKKIF